MSEGAGQQNGRQLQKFPDREDGQERAERSEKHGRKLAWLDTISPICEAAVELLGFLQHLLAVAAGRVPVPCRNGTALARRRDRGEHGGGEAGGGGWGTGKTSLMQMAEARLHRDKIKTVWFNAWKYSEKEAVWNALIQTILLTMKRDPDLADAARRESFRKRVIQTELTRATGSCY